MRRGAELFARARTNVEHMGLRYAILLIGKRRIQGAYGKRMRTGGFMQKRPNGGVKSSQRLVIQVIQKIPEQAQVKPRLLWKIKRPPDVFGKFGFGVIAQLQLQDGIRIHRREVQPALKLGKKFDRLGQRRTNFQD